MPIKRLLLATFTGLLCLPTRSEAHAAPTAVPSTAQRAASPVALTVRAPGDDPMFAEQLTPAITALITRRDIAVDPDAQRGIEVVIAPDPDDRSLQHVAVHLHSVQTSGLHTEFTCGTCGSAELVAKIDGVLDAALAELPEPPAEPEPKAPVVISPTPTPTPTPAPKPPRLAPTGVAGVVLVSSGVAALATGAGLWARRALPHPTKPDWELRTRPPGIALVAIGAAATVTGAVLIALQLDKSRRSRTAAVPLLAPGVAGVRVTHRF